MVEMSKQMEVYFESIQEKVNQCYAIAEKAREKGLDPETFVESPQAKDLAGRVEKLVGPEGIADVIRNLKNEGKNDDQITFQIVSDILDRKIGDIEHMDERVERAIRVGLAIKTMGVVSAPLEGISKIKIRKDQQGNEFLSLYFAGPIRAAGGTVQALCVLIADYVREKSNIPKYKASEAEIGRYVEEVKLYDRIMRLQYPASNEEIRYSVDHLPVEINGDSTEDEEVSAFRDLPRIETNKVRGGACLVLNDGILAKAPKLLKIAKSMNIKGWDWLADLKNISFKEQKQDEDAHKIPPNYKYVKDIIAGRPVFSYPSKLGGHRIRYGRSRNTGLAAGGIHPAAMALLDNFIAIGTQLRIERPGKSTSVCPVDGIEPPIIKLKNGDVLKVTSVKMAHKIFPDIKRILFLGDILFGFGEFSENNHKLIPSGYVEEWWALDLEKAAKILNRLDETIKKFTQNPFENIPTAEEAIKISQEYGIPLHPAYTDFWGNLKLYELKELRNAFLKSYSSSNDRIVIDYDKSIKKLLERALIIHKVEEGKIVFDKDMNYIYKMIFNLLEKNSIQTENDDNVFTYFYKLSSLKIKNKAPYFIGSRMGRPEKSERKSMKGVHALFPLSDKVGNSRLVEKALELGKIQIDICRKLCPNPECNYITIFNICPKCKTHTEIMKMCANCKKLYPGDAINCTKCGHPLKPASEATFNIKDYVSSSLQSLNLSLPKKMKGIFGLTNEFKIPEPLEKGILRAKNQVLVYKTAEIRYDATDIPLTHFKPKEIGTSVDSLKKLGYAKDFKGEPLQDENQIIELNVQDIILSEDCAKYFIKIANFLDDELELFYHMNRFYNISTKNDLIGHLAVGLAPHTSAGIIGRIIGFTPASSIYAHPYWHAAKRRNCLARSEELIIWDDCKKELIITQISDIVEDLIKKGAKTELIDDFGTIIIENLNPEWNVISIDPIKREIIYQPIKHWIKGNSDKWIKITTQTGRTISMTEDHLSMIWNSDTNSYERIKAKFLKIGDSIPLISKLDLPISPPPSNINILEQLSNDLPNTKKFNQFKQQVRLRGAANWIKSKLMNYARSNLSLKTCKPYQRIQPQVRHFFIKLLSSQPFKNPLTTKWYNSIPLSHLEILQRENVFEWNEIPHDARLGMARDDHTINPYIPFNTDLMRLLGYYIAEGHIRDENSCYQINFSVPNPILRKHMKKLIIDLLGSEPYFKKDNEQLVHTGRIHAYLFNYAWGTGKSALSKRIPVFIYTLPLNYRFHFLSAVIDGDGSIIPQVCRTTIYTANYKLALDYCLILCSLGILARLHKEKGGRYGKKVLERYKELGIKPKMNNPLYHVNIPGKENEILFRNIHLMHRRKKENVFKILEKGYPKAKNFEKIGKDLIADKIKKIEIIKSDESSYCLEVYPYDEKIREYHNINTLNGLATAQCDGDEDGIMLLLDPLLNFSRFYLPSKIGGRMDATLVISTILHPNEIDTEAQNIDTLFNYPLEFYEATERYAAPSEIEKKMDLMRDRLGKPNQYEDIGFNIPTSNINDGPIISAYKVYETMDDKISAQLHLAKLIKAVNAKNVAEKILSSHFNPDILGNLRKFAVQEFRCTKCNEKFRRPPISNGGKCPSCGNNIILTVNRGGIEKYIPRAKKLCEEFKLDNYTCQRMDLIEEYVESLTNNPKIKQQKLSDFF